MSLQIHDESLESGLKSHAIPPAHSTNLAGSTAVHRSVRAGLFARVRRHAISRVCALTFIALILTPFTAPFPSYHLAGSAPSQHPFEAIPKDLKTKTGTNHEVGLPSDALANVPLALTFVVARHPRYATQVDQHLPQHQILRV